MKKLNKKDREKILEMMDSISLVLTSLYVVSKKKGKKR